MNTCGTCYFYEPCSCTVNPKPHGHCYSEPPVYFIWEAETEVYGENGETEKEGGSGDTYRGRVDADRRCCRHGRPRDIN